MPLRFYCGIGCWDETQAVAEFAELLLLNTVYYISSVDERFCHLIIHLSSIRSPKLREIFSVYISYEIADIRNVPFFFRCVFLQISTNNSTSLICYKEEV
jgi:hypothetical protein